MMGTDGVSDFDGIKFRNLATNGTYLVTMAIVVVAGLVLRRALETVADDQTQLHEKLDRIVKSGTTYRKSLHIVELVTQLLEREMLTGVIYRIEDSKTLWSLAQMVLFQIAGQNISNRILDIFFHFMWLLRLKPHKITTFSSE